MDQVSTVDLEAVFDEELAAELPSTVDRAAVRRIQVVAELLDESVRIPGAEYRVGIDPLIGVVPVAGDVVSAGISMYIVLESARLGVSYTTLVLMIANVSIDTVGGSIPVVGEVFDAAWKANKWNLTLVFEDLATGTEPFEDVDEEPTQIEVTEPGG